MDEMVNSNRALVLFCWCAQLPTMTYEHTILGARGPHTRDYFLNISKVRHSRRVLVVELVGHDTAGCEP